MQKIERKERKMSNNSPIIKFKDRTLNIGVFEFVNQDGSRSFSCDLQRSYKKKDAEEYTRENIHCYEEDLLKIANICTRAYNAIMSHRAKIAQTQQPAAKQPTPAPAPAPAPIDDDDIPF